VTKACRDRRGSLAVAAMGRLEPAEQAALDAHVDQCDACRSELRELTTVARVFEHADADRVRSAERPRPELRREVLARVATERAARLRRRRLGLAAAAAALVVAASVLAWVLQRTGDITGEQVELNPARGVVTDAWASAVLEAQPWGTQIHLEVVGLEPGTEFEVWLLRLDDSRVSAGTFVTAAGRTMQVVAAAGLPPDQAQGVGLSTEADPVLYGHLRDPE
jgi:predicted anti-sigma-YlaC factor YlaD